MRWSVSYRARWHHCWRERPPKGTGEVRAHAATSHDWGTVIEIDPGAWVRGMRAKLDALLDDPQAERIRKAPGRPHAVAEPPGRLELPCSSRLFSCCMTFD